MTRDELIEKLKAFEWNDVEFKEALRDVPKDAYSTVSAFSNTAGGHLVFGVRHNNGTHEIVGVVEVDKVQNDFLSALRGGGIVSKGISVKESYFKDGDSTLLVFFIPEARRQDKPIFLHNDVKQSYIRRGGGDEKCRPEEIQRFIYDASAERYDCEALESDAEAFFEPESLKWYRRLFEGRNTGTDSSGQSDVEFLHEWGFVNEKGDTLWPSRAGILLFGKGAVVRQYLPRPVVDCQWVNADYGDTLPDQRWTDRIVVEENLITAWRLLVQKFLEHSERPFNVDAASFRRDDMPPDYLAFRESAINLLIHQDYSDHQRKAAIHFYRDRTVLFNPGDLFANPDELLDPVEKPSRNPRIVAAFRRIGLSEQAGTGFRTIFRAWEKLGRVPPVVENDKGRKSFTLHLLKEALLSEEQLLFQARLGVRLSDPEAKAFAVACRKGDLRLQDVKAATCLSAKDSQGVIDRLMVQMLVEEVALGNRSHVQLKEHFVELIAQLKLTGGLSTDQPAEQPVAQLGNLVSDQLATNPPKSGSAQVQPLQQLNPTQVQLIRMCEVARTIAYLMEKIGVSHRSFFRRTHLEPLIRGGVLKMTHPDSLNHPSQAYALTEVGIELVARRTGTNNPEGTTG